MVGSLALLRLNILPNDYISSFISFLATLFVEEKVEEVNVDKLINSFSERYGFIIPRMPMLAILKNCKKKGIILRSSDGRYYVQEIKAKEHSFSDMVCKESKKYDQICTEFIDYVFNSTKIHITKDQAEHILISFLSNNSSKTLALKFDNFEDPLKEEKNVFLIAQFVQYCYENKSTIFDMIQHIASAYIIASALISEVKEEDGKYNRDKYNSLILYLDTPIVLRVLGLNTDEMQVSYMALLEELKGHNNQFKIFQHTYDEIQGILSDCENWIENPLFKAEFASQALRTFVAKKYSKSDIALFIETLETKLNEYNIIIDDRNFYDQRYNRLQIDESPIREAIINTYKENTPGFNELDRSYTIECDVKSISAIFKLRNSTASRSYSSAKYLFLTSNVSLAFISRKFTSSQNPSASYKVYPCITDVFLGTSIWLSEPVQKIDTFSRKKLLADCSAAVMPSGGLISSLSLSIERLYNEGKIKKEHYYLLKKHAFDNHYLVDKTLNDEAEFSDKITEEILEDIKNELTAPYIKQIKEKEDELHNKENALRYSEDRIRELYDEKEKRNEEKIEQIRESEILANKAIQILKRVTIPIFTAAIVALIAVITKLFNLTPILYVILIIISALISIGSALILALMQYNKTVKKKIKQNFKEKYLLKQYKKNIKDESSTFLQTDN